MSDAPANMSRGASLATIALAAGLLAVVHAVWPAIPIAALLGLAALIIGAGVLATAEMQSNVRNIAIIGACAGLIGFGVAIFVKPTAGSGGATTAVDPKIIEKAVRDAFEGIRSEQENSPAMVEARKRAAQTYCLSNMRQIARALMMYGNDNYDIMPGDLMLLERMGMVRAKQFQSPMEGNDDNTCDYYYVPYPRHRGGTKNWLLLWTDLAYTDGDGANVVYTDGQAEYLKANEFKQAMARFIREYKRANQGKEPPIVKPY